MGWIGCIRCEKMPTRLPGTNLCINCTGSTLLHQCLCSNETVWNDQKYEFGVQWGRLGAFASKKSKRDFIAQTCALIAPVQLVLHQLSCSNKMVRNTPKQEFGVQSDGSCTFIVKKCRYDFVAQTCPLIAQVRPILHRSSCSNETVQNAPNMSLGSNGVDQVRSLRKIATRYRGTNLCINCTSSAHYAPKFVR
jgi:hypothetical protein